MAISMYDNEKSIVILKNSENKKYIVIQSFYV